MNGKCGCWEGWLGRDCSIPADCFEACHNVCEIDTKSEKCMYCIGQCETARNHPVMGRHDPFNDLSTTLLELKTHGHPKHQEVYIQEVVSTKKNHTGSRGPALLQQSAAAKHSEEEDEVHHEVSVIDLSDPEIFSVPSMSKQ